MYKGFNMFNKEGIPFFTIAIPFLSIIFISFFTVSYHLKLSNESLQVEIEEYKKVYTLKNNITQKQIDSIIEERINLHKEKDKKFKRFILVMTISVLIFMALFSFLMISIIGDVVKKYKSQVQLKEEKLENLNKNLASKVELGIQEAKEKDKAILRQSKLARLGGMISMIAHQWRQPLTELSGVLMELETATRFKKVNDKHILHSIERSDKLIEFMSNTIDDFRNFYKPDKKKESFLIKESCIRAYGIIDATLKDLGIEFILEVKENSEAYGYPTDFSQVVLNIIGNAKDILIERKIKGPKIYLTIDRKNDKSIVTIKDNAGGIKEEYLDTLFDPYFSTKDSGTGLGLYISKHIIEKNMAGELSVKNDEDGAVFEIVLDA